MAGEELPPVVAVLEGDDSSFLAMLERDIEAARAFAADIQSALEEGLGGVTFSGAQVSSEGVGAAGEVIGAQLATGIEEGAAGLDLGPQMEHAAEGAEAAGLAAGEQFALGVEEGAAAAGDAVSEEIGPSLSAGLAEAGTAAAQALDEALTAGTATIGETLGGRISEQLRLGLDEAAQATMGILGQINAQGIGGALAGSAVGGALLGRLAAHLSDSAAEAGAAAGVELSRNLTEAAVAALSEADFAAFMDQLTATASEAGAAAGAAGADALAAGMSTALTGTDLIAQGLSTVGQSMSSAATQAGQSAADALAESQEKTLSGTQAYEAELDAVFESILRGGQGMTVQLAAAMTEAFQGIEADTTGFTQAELAIFDEFYQTLEARGDQAALDLAERLRIVSETAISGMDFLAQGQSTFGMPIPGVTPTPGGGGQSPVYGIGIPEAIPQAPRSTESPATMVPGLGFSEELKTAGTAASEVSGELAGVAGAAGEAGTAVGGLAGAMGGPLTMAAFGVMSFLPMVTSMFSSNSQQAQATAQAWQQVTQAVSQDSDMVGANTVAAIQNELITSGAADTLQQYGISLTTATSAMAGSKDAQDGITGSLDAQITNLQALIREQTAHSQGVSTDIENEEQQVQQLEATRDAMKGLENDIVAVVAKQNDLSQATLNAEKAAGVFDVQVRAGVLSLQQQAQQSNVSAQALGAYMMTLVPGTQAYTDAVDDQIIALEHSALSAQINATALNDSLPIQGQLSQAALQAAIDYQQAGQATSQYTNAVTALYGQYGTTSQAQAQFTLGLDGLKGTITSGTDAVNLSTEAGAKNFQAFEQVAQAAEGVSEKIYQQTGDTKQAAQALQNMAGMLDTAAYKAGLTKDQVRQLNIELFGVPTVKDIAIGLTGVQAAQDIINGLIKPESLFIKTEIENVNNTPTSGPTYSGGALGRARAAGGPVSAGELYVVGETGRPEWFVPGADGYITPMDMLQPSGVAAAAAAGGFAGATPQVNVAIYLDGQLMTQGVRSESRYVLARNSTTGF